MDQYCDKLKTTIHSKIAFILLEYPKFSNERHISSLYTSQYMPGISLIDYIRRISRYAIMTDEILICALVYIDRFILAKKISLTSHEIHRIFLISSVIAMKFYYDDFFNNEYYSDVCGISLDELNELEKDFLEGLDYKLSIDETTYKRYESAILKYRRKSSL